jgi:ribosomal protein S18 acetylase RimI-like enzyme
MDSSHITVRPADLRDPHEGAALVSLLDAYATDLMGGGTPLRDEVKERLPRDLAARANAFVLLAFVDGTPAGAAVSFEAYSTFEALPLMNLHDFVVAPSFRGRAIAPRMLEALEAESRRRNCCKITLEVLENNHRARGIYAQFGFASYELDPAAGKALFLQKKL